MDREGRDKEREGGTCAQAGRQEREGESEERREERWSERGREGERE